jgi:2C-methyl-D-erythritol 2,4-cyclodiphosphate synthase
MMCIDWWKKESWCSAEWRYPHHMGLAGHSDADVLVHAIMDALLGAAGEGDIGRHFPDTDQKYKGISSLLLLERVGEIIKKPVMRWAI